VLASAVALGGFRVGLMVQDRMNQRVFNGAVQCVLAALGAFLVLRSLR
jgi:hypothetical protein